MKESRNRAGYEIISENASFGGRQLRCRHTSTALRCDMHFSVYLPPLAQAGASDGIRLPVVYWFSGLTCTDQNFVQKAGAQRVAAELGLILVAPDTSPRGDQVPDDNEGLWDLGKGAGFYVNATRDPWKSHYRMYDYVVDELPCLIHSAFPVDADAQSVCGHSMGGHGALTIALKNPDTYRSVSAFAPISAPSQCTWGQKAFRNYLGEDKSLWREHDAAALVTECRPWLPLLIDQGDADEFLQEQLKPELLLEACRKAGYPVTYNLRAGYDHSYFFIATFIEDHLRFHHSFLMPEANQ
ncbi:MAG: S-formylglutathione hydrolase [Pseudohongiellaceae bacterium]